MLFFFGDVLCDKTTVGGTEEWGDLQWAFG